MAGQPIIEDEEYRVWVEYFTRLADALRPYRSKRKTLIKKLKSAFGSIPLELPTLEAKDLPLVDIDPFTIFSCINREIKLEKRLATARAFAEEFGVDAEIPQSFPGVPVMTPLNILFYHFTGVRGEHDIDNLWEMFDVALEYADTHSPESREKFVKLYDTVRAQKGVSWNLTMGLYWVRPMEFLSFDSCNREFFTETGNMPEEFVNLFSRRKSMPSGERYMELLDLCHKAIETGACGYGNIPELSQAAWVSRSDEDGEEEDDYEAAEEEAPVEVPAPEVAGAYTADDFLREVYMDRAQYTKIVRALGKKRNIILQGAPGVGKTFMAKRLAWSMMGGRTDARVMEVQFHQSYSYEDFIEGYRPDGAGFVLKKGPFLQFCDKARADAGNDYFCIIDEINRGHLGKIFGELFMLLENDKRGDSASVKLLYSGAEFSIPCNVYIIGMMNTADRSLAMVDYALRRRFAFVEVTPGFDTDGFVKYRKGLASEPFNRLISKVMELNDALGADDSLGTHYCIGHSFFCGFTPGSVQTEDLEDIVEFELIPLLQEYWFDDRTKCDEWSQQLRGSIR